MRGAIKKITDKDSSTKIQEENEFRQWFEKIYEENFERLFRYAYSITKDKQLAEDVIADVFANLWQKKQTNINILKLRSYLHVSVKHLAISVISKDFHRFNYAKYEESLEIADILDPESLLVVKEINNLISDIISKMNPISVIIYDMSRNKGYSTDKIARELEMQKRTVEGHLYKVIKRIKKSLEAYYDKSDKIYSFYY